MVAMMEIVFITGVSIAFLKGSNKVVWATEGKNRFVEIYSSPNYNADNENGFKIYYDKETKVQYLEKSVYKGGGITVLVDQEGKPLLYEGE